ncbi:hypothetical protein SAMN04488077_108112 [Roseovarius tolerans]|uniref:Uncharacterized protein n=1 Tax=Roseovarius tolerans TaxID=74031 RepID=A0A1H8BGW0_9RHOB|nr:hypothetical protein [Roseovarius tolerans]SEM82052.1 hypothetical protein SAMN04488077_108112 [Roseovarius tolerans]
MSGRMSRSKSLGIALSLILAAGSTHAADFSDPTWPCIQRKVPTLSVGLMWTHPLPETPEADPDLKREIDRLAAKLALRRLEVEELRPDIEEFAARHDGAPDMLGHVFQRVFTTLSTRRAQVISGIEEFSLSQIALSERIDTARAEMGTLMNSDSPDFDRVDALEEQLDWDQVIYTDRQSTITYLCETPTLIEKRLYSLAQILQQQINEPG